MYKKKILGVAVAALLSCSPLVHAGNIAPGLQGAVSQSVASEDIAVIIKFADKLDIRALRKEVREVLRERYSDPRQRKKKRRAIKRAMMVDGLKKKSRRAKRLVQAFLKLHGERRKLKLLWATNSVAGSVPAYLIDDLADLPGVEDVILDAKVQGPGPGTPPSAPSYWNLDATGVPALWQLGHTGIGVVVATMDTGVDATHPDLGTRWRGGDNSWFDPSDQHLSPADSSGHGTQVMGLILGGAAGGYQVGMAPDSQWIAAKIFDDSNEATLSGIHSAYQWMLDPDGDPATDDSPDIVNNSWALNGTVDQCNQEFAQNLALLKEAEIAVLFSGGNYGPNVDTSVSPANDPSVVSVGAVDVQFNVDSGSSRGAGACDGGIYPHLVAPGASVLTTDRMPLFYNIVSGTSFAVAHLSGGMALLKGAFPEATVTQLEASLINTAMDLGAAGPDDDYGNGLIDVEEAYYWLETELGGGGGSPGTLQFSATAYSADENVASLALTVSRSGGSMGTVSIDYASADGSARAGQDYGAVAGTLTFAEGELSQGINVTILDDSVYEGDEDFTLTLSNPQGGAALGTVSSAAATILEDELQPQPGTLSMALAGYTVAESGASVQLTVLRSGGSDGVVTVDYATANGSATAGSDYSAASGSLTFQDAQLSKTISIGIQDDTEYEGDESFTLTLSNAGGGATLGMPAVSAVDIGDDDPPPGPADADADGFTADLDCNDNNASIFPGAAEVKHDGVDQDCNGYDLTIDVTRARYLASKDKLIVWSTSDMGSQAGLSMNVELANGGNVSRNLTWKGKKNRWQKYLKNFSVNFGAIPVSVTVSGVEGVETISVEQR